jgi:hypothetical protein
MQQMPSTTAGTDPICRALRGGVGISAMSIAHKDCVHRAERASEAFARALIWGGLAVCVVGSAIYDIWMITW